MAADPGGSSSARQQAAADAPTPTAVDAASAYRALAPSVLSYLRGRRVPDPENVLGEVFFQVSRDLGRFHGDAEDLRRWVFTIARHRAVDAHRAASRRPEVPTDPRPGEEAQADAGSPPDPVDPELIDALDQLTEEQREIVLLRFVADLSLEGTAALTGRSVVAVKALQHRGLESLRRALDDA